MKKGLIIVNTGDGKGKTTAALGMVLRAWGHGLQVAVLQFIKRESERLGEARAARQLGIEWIATGDGFTWNAKDVDETVARARYGWELAQEKITSGRYDLLVLDEFTYPLQFGWLDCAAVIDWLRQNKPAEMHLVITGRNAPAELVAFADLVTEMRSIKHPHDQGVAAQRGVEF